LSEEAALSILKGIYMMLNTGGIVVFTSRGLQFIDYCDSLRQIETTENKTDNRNPYSNCFYPKKTSIEKYQKGEFQFYKYGYGTGELNSEFYGEASIPENWIKKNLSGYFELVDFEPENMVEDLDQTIFVLKKKN
jgi:hypothetical protein